MFNANKTHRYFILLRIRRARKDAFESRNTYLAVSIATIVS